jgi:hypothetical protein
MMVLPAAIAASAWIWWPRDAPAQSQSGLAS